MNKVLWAIDNELDEAKFERLCVDLLRRQGFLDISPIEPQDGGRDAEELPRRGRSREGHPTFFQFSKEEDWKRKLRRDAGKLAGRKSEFDTFVFVTSRKARGVDIDALKTEIRESYGWTLIVFAREWLRLQLEEANPDLAVKYLGTDVLNPPLSPGAAVLLTEPTDLQLKEINQLIESDQADAAVLQLKRLLERNPERPEASQLLAWAYYKMHRYEEALAEINRTIRRDNRPEYRSIRACILAEKGIRDADRPSVLESRRIFEELLTSQPVHTFRIFYNLGNVLSELGDYEAAIKRYQTATELDERQPAIWKNLASAYHHAGNHDEEMKCFDKALELDPRQPEALISKATSLILDFKKPEEAIPLLELALTLNPDTLARWPYICYWLAFTHEQLGHFEDALDYAEQGLNHRPGDIATKRLTSHLLRKLARQDTAWTARAQAFWRQEIEDEPLNFDARRNLASLHLSSGDTAAAWKLIDESFEALDIADVCSLQSSGFTAESCLEALYFLPRYANFRSLQPVSEYWDMIDPLFDLPFAPPPAEFVDRALRTYLAVPFGNGMRFLNSAKDRNDPAVLAEFFDIVRDGVRTAISQAARPLAQPVPSKEDGIDALAGKTTEIMMFMALAALREFGKQRGYIMGYFEVLPASSEEALGAYDEVRLHDDVLVDTFTVLNEELAILRT
jgi:tetratricopeptide (TPR) repeat protein